MCDRSRACCLAAETLQASEEMTPRTWPRCPSVTAASNEVSTSGHPSCFGSGMAGLHWITLSEPGHSSCSSRMVRSACAWDSCEVAGTGICRFVVRERTRMCMAMLLPLTQCEPRLHSSQQCTPVISGGCKPTLSSVACCCSHAAPRHRLHYFAESHPFAAKTIP